MKRFLLVIIILVMLGVVYVLFTFFKSENPQGQEGGFLQGGMSGQGELRPAENLPENNPFRETKTNPFEGGYSNPFE